MKNLEKLISDLRWNDDMSAAPRDGTSVLVKINGEKQQVVQWENWFLHNGSTAWRPLPDNRAAGVMQVLVNTIKQSAAYAFRRGDFDQAEYLDSVFSEADCIAGDV